MRWLLVLAIVAVAAWLWWRHEHPAKLARVVAPATRQIHGAPTDWDAPKPEAVFRARRATCLKRKSRWRAAVFRRVPLTPCPVRKRAGQFPFFRKWKICRRPACWTRKPRAQLTLDAPLLTTYVVTTNDLARLQPLGKTWLAKSQQSALDYETELELVAEKGHAHPALIQQLNPNVNWTNLAAGTVLKIPDVNYPAPTNKAAFVVIHLGEKFLEAFDVETNLLAHFPCSIAASVEKRPVGELHVIAIAPNPNYTFDPELFPESPEVQAIGHKLILPPGPNNPVGVAWIGLDKPGYGIHGTPNPEQVGRTESHGCFRLANWDAEYLSTGLGRDAGVGRSRNGGRAQD